RRQGPLERRGPVELPTILIEDRDPKDIGPLDRADIRLHLAGQAPEERRLAGAVAAKQADLRPRFKVEVEPREQRLAAKLLGDAGRLDELLRLPPGRLEIDADRARRGVAGLHRPQIAHQSLRLGGAGDRLRGPRLRAALEPLDLAANAIGERLLLPG